MNLKSLFLFILALLLLRIGTAWGVGSFWNYRPDPNDKGFYYPLPQVVEITSPFGWRTHPLYGDRRLHAGVDLGAPEGMPVLSAHSGYVRYADWGDGYGNMVIVEYADGLYQTLYGHLSEILVKDGEAIKPRQVIGKVGSTGGVTGPHLHFELLQKQGANFQAIDPESQVKSVEPYVNVKPVVLEPSPPPSPAAASLDKPNTPSTWQAPNLSDRPQQANDPTRLPIADVSQIPPSPGVTDAIAPPPSQNAAPPPNGILSFDLKNLSNQP